MSVVAKGLEGIVANESKLSKVEGLEGKLSYLGCTIDTLLEHSTFEEEYVFISYCHRDKAYLDRLLVHLNPLERKGLIDAWVDTRLLAGDRWKMEIDKALRFARAAVLLISADFLASRFIGENELPPLLRAAEDKGTLIVPVLLSPCRFAREPTLSNFQAINSPDEPLSRMDYSEQEEVYDKVALAIEHAIEE